MPRRSDLIAAVGNHRSLMGNRYPLLEIAVRCQKLSFAGCKSSFADGKSSSAVRFHRPLPEIGDCYIEIASR